MKNLFKFKNRKYDVSIFGRVTIDLNPIDKNMELDKSKKFFKYLGGSAANISIGTSLLGLKTVLVSCISNDQNGKFLKNYLKKSNVDTSYIQIAQNGEKTGLTFTEIKSEKESSILMYRDNVADLSLEIREDHEDLIKNSSSIIISGTALSKSPSRETCLNAIKLAKKHKTFIIFDIDYRPYTWGSIIETNLYYNLVASQSDIIVGSREEFDLTNYKFTSKNSDLDISNYYFNKKSSLIVIKHGSKGSVAFTKNGEKYNVSIFPIKLLKSFGGGDAYISAMLYGIFNNKNLKDSLTLASAHAANAVSSHSCSEAMLSQKELFSFIKKYENALPIVVKENE